MQRKKVTFFKIIGSIIRQFLKIRTKKNHIYFLPTCRIEGGTSDWKFQFSIIPSISEISKHIQRCLFYSPSNVHFVKKKLFYSWKSHFVSPTSKRNLHANFSIFRDLKNTDIIIMWKYLISYIFLCMLIILFLK